ncbi:arylsulfatase B-like [Amphibalanus amphitrite]|uniref:arylsulfatase B-like n=1 Tax=Amphibalanus amphitrite TaxID=1232801 RepID=UPI001C912F25|nr:arylsulfatase B-like [Amphibalanus amphitrite]
MALAAVLLAALLTVASAAQPPHIILIVADDLGFDDTSLRGSDQIPTPNLDALAFSGAALGRYYVHALCTPSRAALLTGRLPTHTGLQTDVIYAAEPYGLGLNETLLPQLLEPLGYSCHAVGKWHLGFYRRAYTPSQRGFKSHLGFWAGHGDYYDHTAKEGEYWGLDLHRDLEPVGDQLGRYSTDIFTEEAERLISAHNASRPLFLYLAHQAVHAGNSYAPLQPGPAIGADQFPWITDPQRRAFAAVTAALDAAVGRVVAALARADLLSNSLIVVTTDNGGAVDGVDGNAASNWPLRGGKYTLWEGGVRGSALVWSPRLPRWSRPVQRTVHITDWLPTLLEAAGGAPDRLPALDGVSQWPVLTGAAPDQDTDRTILHNIDPSNNYSALMVDARYKLVQGEPFPYNGWYSAGARNSSGLDMFALLSESPAGQAVSQLGRPVDRETADSLRRQLAVECDTERPTAAHCADGCVFDVVADPCETTDLSDTQPLLRRQLEERLDQLRASMVPSRKVPADPRADPKLWNYTWTYWADLLPDGCPQPP